MESVPLMMFCQMTVLMRSIKSIASQTLLIPFRLRKQTIYYTTIIHEFYIHNWLVVGSWTSSGKYFIRIKEDNKQVKQYLITTLNWKGTSWTTHFDRHWESMESRKKIFNAPTLSPDVWSTINNTLLETATPSHIHIAHHIRWTALSIEILETLLCIFSHPLDKVVH